MTHALTPVAVAVQRLAAALSTIPDLRVVTSVAASVSPPAAVIGPPKLAWRVYNAGSQPITGQWNVHLVMPMNQYAMDTLLSLIAAVASAIETYTPGVVASSGPSTYPSPSGALPSYVLTVQMEPGG